MQAVEYEGVEADRSVGEHTNQIEHYQCPRCDGGMMRRIDLKIKKVRYEECNSSCGSFFDAGEFTDLIRDAIAILLSRRSTD